VIVVLSKPPDPAVAERIAKAAARTGKRAVLGFLTTEGRAQLPAAPEGVEIVASLEEAAARAARLVGGPVVTDDADLPSRETPGMIRGLFCGGSLCFEAAATAGRGDFIDFGADEYTAGRAHPMIDPTIRNDHFKRVARDPHTGAVILDVVLGLGAHPDPAAELAPLIEAAQSARRHLTVVVSLCGTDRDPQGLARQRSRLTEAGALVTRNAAHAGRLARGATGGSS
jgi:FdrA protein